MWWIIANLPAIIAENNEYLAAHPELQAEIRRQQMDAPLIATARLSDEEQKEYDSLVAAIKAGNVPKLEVATAKKD